MIINISMKYMLVISLVFIIGAVGVVLFFYRKKPKTPKKGKASGALNADLSDARQQSEIILNVIEDGVMLLDEQKTIRSFNPAAARVTGWQQKDAIGVDYSSVITLVDAKGQPYIKENDPIEKAFATGQLTRDTNANLSTQSKTVISLDITVSPLTDSSGVATGAVVVFRDVSEERKENQQRAEFVSTASHEMRTPVAAIEGYLALALNDKVSTIDAKARSFLEKAHESTQHLGQLFQDLLTSAKAEDGRLTNHPEVVEIGAMLETLTDGLKFAAQKKNLGVEFVLGASDNVIDARGGTVVKPLYYAYLDPDRLREVITNLFDNAVKYTDAGKITIGLTGDNNVVQLRITDTGNGIPAEDIPHLFEKFYRVDNSNTRTVGGTGLGLFICRKIVELYSGRIWVESTVGKGSTFYINFPRLSTERAKQLQQQTASKVVTIATK